MAKKRFSVLARVSTDNPVAVAPILDALTAEGSVTAAEDGKEFLVEAVMEGESARAHMLLRLRPAQAECGQKAPWTVDPRFDYSRYLNANGA